jgi:hypothetical protein
MRKLTVKNFSVIEDAELEFGKITVLIGPQASGKSLLCKLAYFLSKKGVEIALTALLRKDTFDVFKTDFIAQFIKWFPVELWANSDSSVRFESSGYGIHVSASLNMNAYNASVEFSEKFRQLFSTLESQIGELPDTGADSRKSIIQEIELQFNLLQTDTYIHRSVYIPDGRAIFTNQSLGFAVLNNPDIDPLVRDFSLEVRLGYNRYPNPIAGEKALRALDEIRMEMLNIAGGYIEGRNLSASFRRSSDGRSIPLTLLSSGTQEMIPLLNVLGQIATEQRDRIVFPRPNNLTTTPRMIILSKGLVYVEEPEANVFPDTQNKLVRLFAWLSHEPTLDFEWVITTHSPYILSSFNNLIEAGQAARNHPELKEEIAKIIPEQYWIADGSFKAYAVENGKLTSILNESGFVESNYLDQVSETIGDEFDKLLKLEYDNAKAS